MVECGIVNLPVKRGMGKRTSWLGTSARDASRAPTEEGIISTFNVLHTYLGTEEVLSISSQYGKTEDGVYEPRYREQ